jgi:predicted dipeptidase
VKYLIAASVGAALALSATSSGAQEIAKPEITALIGDLSSQQAGAGFSDFLNTPSIATKYPFLGPVIAKHKSAAALSGTERVNLYRLLGIFIRLKHKDALVRTLGELVAIPTDKKEDQPQFENPNIQRFGRAIERIATGFGLSFRNVDNRIFEVTLPGTGPDAIGVFTHGDVVPADPEKWVLPDGKRLPPFQLTVMGDRMYGRGASDDKSEITAVLYAMGAIRRAGFKLDRTIRLAIETTEETGGSGTDYYKARTKLAPYNIVLDGAYPVGVAEKGFGVVMGKFPVRAGQGPGAEIIGATGGLVVNQIPSRAQADIRTSDPARVKAMIDREAGHYVAANGANFRIETAIADHGLTVTVYGKSTHSARPSRGVNPVSRLFNFIHEARKEIPFQGNHFTDAASYVAANWGLDYLGGKLGIGFSDPFMGALTAPVTYVKVKQGALHLAVNPRAPRGREPDRIIAAIRQGIDKWQAETSIDATFDIKLKRYMYRNPKGPWITTLLDIFGDVTGVAAKPRSSNGYTSARQLPNGVQFGPGMPGEKGTAHRANEYKNMSNFLRDTQIITEMLLRLGNLERME